ncbi:MAG: hypothetical protein BGO98_14160 [Myxococcales bacterium 68-20]|nr:hypothetical protein [Myxococcales bacterium]OJY21110.1 MAG: hypothetical protein BGO98_14160 [Myxococcales bacterium 68-20]
MRPSRVLVAALSGVAYPSLIAVVATGILTFTAATVFAESSVATFCSDPLLTECSGSTEMAQCSSCTSSACACIPWDCRGDRGLESRLGCAAIATCDEARFTDCAGKTTGDTCGPNKECVPSRCGILDGGAWSFDQNAHDCVPRLPSPDAASGPNGELDGSAAPSSPGASGCSLQVRDGGASSLFASTSVMVGLALLWRARRRRR